VFAPGGVHARIKACSTRYGGVASNAVVLSRALEFPREAGHGCNAGAGPRVRGWAVKGSRTTSSSPVPPGFVYEIALVRLPRLLFSRERKPTRTLACDGFREVHLEGACLSLCRQKTTQSESL